MTTPLPVAPPAEDKGDLRALLATKRYDFIDFGSSKGGSLELGKKWFGGVNGLGVDKDPKKVEAARAAGFEVALADATALDCPPNAVSFALMLHFLEHLPGLNPAAGCIRSACRVARDFVYIRHPWCDSDMDLMRLGYKFYWADWKGHPNRFGMLQFHNAVSRITGVKRWHVLGRGRIRNLRHTSIVPLSTPANSGALIEADVANRPNTALPFELYGEIACLIQLSDSQAAVSALDQLKGHDVLFDSAG